jgi:hypothetical protein
MQVKTALSWTMVLLLAAMALGASAEERTMEATAGWIAEGQLYQVKEKHALFAGTFEGLLFVKNKQGQLDGVKMVCPGLVEMDLGNRQESGAGRCIFTSRDKEHIYAKWNCAGELLQGCEGDFMLIGGTGRFENITGNSAFEIRSDMAELVPKMTESSLDVTARGVTVWPALTYKIP